MRGAILFFLSVCVAFGAAAEPQALSPSVDQGKSLANILKFMKTMPPSGVVAASPYAQQVLLSQAEMPQSDVCAIPLLEVQVDRNTAPMPTIRGREGFRSEMPAVQVPAPTCKQAAPRR